MSLQEFRSKIDGIMDVVFAGGLANHTAIIELLIYLIFLRELSKHDDEQKQIDDRYVPVLGGDLASYRWINLLSLNADVLFKHLNEAFEKLAEQGTDAVVRDLYKKAHIKLYDGAALRTVVHRVEDLMQTLEKEEKMHRADFFGDLYEYLLSKISAAGTGGQFRTPRHIVKFIVDVVDPGAGETICDPACGTGGFLVSALEHLKRKYTGEAFQKEHRYPMDKLTDAERKFLYHHAFTGFDSDPDMIKFGMMNLYFHRLEKAIVRRRNTLTETQGETAKWDIILANPPFAGKIDRGAVSEEIHMNTGATEVLSLNYMIRHTTNRGRCGVIVPEGVIFNTSGAHKAIRQKLVEDAGLWAVVSLPGGVFNPYAGVKTSILFFDKTKKNKNDEILFIKIANDGFDLGAQRRPIEKNDLPKALEILRTFRSPVETHGNASLPEGALLVPKTKIAENDDYNLSGDRYRVATDYSNAKWDAKDLGKLCEIVTGKKDVNQGNPEGEYPFFTCAKENTFIDEYSFNTEALLIAGNGDVGAVKYYKGKFDAYQRTYVLSNFKNVNAKYLFYVLNNSLKKDMQLQKLGNTMPYIKLGMLQNFKIPLPPLEIQEQIIRELSGYEKIISGAKQITQNWKPKIDIDPEWKKVKLGEVFKIESGGTPSSTDRKYWDGDIGWATLVDIPATIEIITDTKRKITPEGLKNSSAKLFPKGTVMVSSRATIGRIAIAGIEMSTNQGFKNVIIDAKNEPVYIAYALSEKVEEMVSLASGGTFKEISKTHFSNLEIPLPPLSIQKQIVSQIEAERILVEGNKKLIRLYEQKTKEVVAKLWKA